LPKEEREKLELHLKELSPEKLKVNLKDFEKLQIELKGFTPEKLSPEKFKELKEKLPVEKLKDLKDVELDRELKHLKDVEIDLQKVIPAEIEKLKESKDKKDRFIELRKDGSVRVEPLDTITEVGVPTVKSGDVLYRLGDAAKKGDKRVNISVNRDGDKFTAKHTEDNLTLTVTGIVKDGTAVVEAILVQESGKDGKPTTEGKYGSLDKAPEKLRERIKRLIEQTEKGKVDFKIEQ
jgi:hypothetical protein